MKKVNLVFTITCAVICTIVFMTGCTGAQKTIDEPEITVEYLAGEYAAQLVRDGAEKIFGIIDMTEDEDGTIWVDVSEREYVEDSGQPNGFYIADKNLESTYYLSTEARATFLPGGARIAAAMNFDEFVAAAEQDLIEFGSDNPDYAEYKLYDIYVMGDQIELLLARYIP